MKIKLDREKILSPAGLFFIYIIISSFVISVFRFIFPAENPPLNYFSAVWRFLGCGETIINLFPALALSALVIPFGIRKNPPDKFSSFSPRFLQKLSPSILGAIIAAGIYGLLFILILPLINNYQTDLRSQGRLYKLSVERARYFTNRGEWHEAARFLDICERIWPGGPEVIALHTETSLMLNEIYLRQQPLTSAVPSRYELTESGSLSYRQAMDLAGVAMFEERYFDAHWLASVARDLAVDGSIESQVAAEFASRAWNAVSSLEPNSRETQAYRIYHLKRDAYRALLSSDWIQSYYLFRELLSIVPNDPDGLHYINLCERGIVNMAFFVDEMELRESPAGALFSLPYGNGRMVMRFSSLSLFADAAFGIGLEILAFDREGILLWRLDAPFAKLLPLPRDTEYVSILMRALDRYDSSLRWEPDIMDFSGFAPSNAQLTLNISWKDFYLLAEIRRGFNNFSVAELMAVSQLGSGYGYVPEIFEAGIIGRFAEPVLFLPFLIFALSAGWRFRAPKKSYIWILMLGVLPLVFNGIFHFFRYSLNNIALFTVYSFGFSIAIPVFVVGCLVLFLLSLIILASQHD